MIAAINSVREFLIRVCVYTLTIEVVQTYITVNLVLINNIDSYHVFLFCYVLSAAYIALSIVYNSNFGFAGVYELMMASPIST